MKASVSYNGVYHAPMRRFIPIALLVFGNIFVWAYAFPAHTFSVSFLDVGQGDAILIESPTGVQMLIDGGPGTSVLRELGKKLSFFDRSIDVVIETHPDQDHIAGLVDVFERYEVGVFIEPGIENDTPASRALAAAVAEEKGIKQILARRGMRLVLGGGVYADVLFPDRDVSQVETNTGSIVMRVVYGETEFMLTGDSPQAIERYLATMINHSDLESDILKAGHHGSKTSSNEEFVKAVNPNYVVYSRGCDNRYGHPAPETIALFQKLSIPALDTCEDDTVTFRSDGRNLRLLKLK